MPYGAAVRIASCPACEPGRTIAPERVHHTRACWFSIRGALSCTQSNGEITMEHRWGERFPLDVSVRLNAGTTVVMGLRLSNASVSGGLVDTDVRLPVFSHVVVEFDIPGNSGPLKQHVPAYVVRHGQDGIGLEWQEFA